MTQPPADDVLVSRRGAAGHLRLNRPAKINALTAGMVSTMADALAAWRADAGVALVVIDGAGDRGLCAGGDVATVYDGIRGAAPHPGEFWRAEYRMNLQISRYPKPVVALMDGLVLGGGIGIAGHASMRIVTETAQCAMPETAIGLAPDVGGLFLLSRAPGQLGTFAALGGARLNADDSLAAGLADVFLPRAALPALIERLTRIPAGGPTGKQVQDAVARVAREYPAAAPAGRWPADRGWIDACYSGDDAGAILTALRAREEPAAARAAAHLAAMSPTAVAVTLRALRAAAAMTLADVVEQDYRLSMAFTRHPDLAEGIRARIIDKDRHPRWHPATLADVTAADVDAFFAQ